MKKGLDSMMSIFSDIPLVISPVSESGNAFAKLGLNPVDIFFLFIKLYGPLTIFGCFSIVGFFYTLKQLRSQDFKKCVLQNKCTFCLMFFYIVFFSFCIIAAIDFIKPLTGLGSQRFLFSVYSLIPLPAGIGLSLLISDTQTFFSGKKSYAFNRLDKMNLIKSGFLLLTLTVCLSIAIFTLFSSPITYRPNEANTVKDVIGADWVLNKGDNRYNILWDIKSVSPPDRYLNAMFGTVSISNYPQAEPNLYDDEFAHFRYYKFSKLGSSIKADKYLMTREDVNLLIYRQLYPLFVRYNLVDYLKLSNDNSVNLIYSNGEMKTYFVLPL